MRISSRDPFSAPLHSPTQREEEKRDGNSKYNFSKFNKSNKHEEKKDDNKIKNLIYIYI